jgi:hypothetical protein
LPSLTACEPSPETQASAAAKHKIGAQTVDEAAMDLDSPEDSAEQ